MRILILAAIMSFAAVLPLPYGYYMFMRLAITVIALYAAFQIVDRESTDFWFMVGIALLFNPIMPVFLSKLIWVPIDIVLGIYFLNMDKKYKA